MEWALTDSNRRPSAQQCGAGPAPAATADAGPGSALLERLAQRLGWQVLWQSPSAIVIDGIDATEAGMVGPPGLEPGTKGL